MILKLNNKSKNFYDYLGPIFGSREVERTTNDRFYDDDDKEWYIFFDKSKPKGFISVKNYVIKNVWGYKDDYILKTLIKINKNIKVKESVVTKHFLNLYIKSRFKIIGEKGKNFVIIRSDKIEKN